MMIHVCLAIKITNCLVVGQTLIDKSQSSKQLVGPRLKNYKIVGSWSNLAPVLVVKTTRIC